MASDVILVALDKGEAMPSDGLVLVVDNVSYDVEELIPPDDGFGPDVVFAVRYKRTNIQQPAHVNSKWNANQKKKK